MSSTFSSTVSSTAAVLWEDDSLLPLVFRGETTFTCSEGYSPPENSTTACNVFGFNENRNKIVLDHEIMQQSDCVFQKLQLNTVTRRSSCDIDRGATLRHAWSIHLKEEKKNAHGDERWNHCFGWDNSGHGRHHIRWVNKNTQTIMSDNHNRICAWFQSKGKTMFANLPNKSSWNILLLATGVKSFVYVFIVHLHVFHMIVCY